MRLYQLVLKDIRRRRRRVLYAALGVVVGIMTFVGILTVSRSAEERIYRQLDKYGANLTVTPAINNLDMRLGDLSMGTLTVGDNYIPEEKVLLIKKIADDEIRMALGIDDEAGPAVAAPKLFVTTRIKGTSVMVVGVQPKEERQVRMWWRMGHGDFLEGSNDAVAGATVAQLLKLSPGDSIDLNGVAMRVVGVLQETGSNDDYQVFVPLATLQNAFSKKGLVSSVDVRALCNGCPVEIIANSINENIPGVRALAVKQIAETEMGVVDRLSKFLLALAGITLAVGGFGVVNTMLTSVHERMKDIGIMRAIGASGRQIVKIFVYESVVVGLTGGIIGYLAGTLLAWGVGPLFFEGTVVSIAIQYLPLSLTLAVLIAVAASVYPAFLATKVKVADSFRAL